MDEENYYYEMYDSIEDEGYNLHGMDAEEDDRFDDFGEWYDELASSADEDEFE